MLATVEVLEKEKLEYQDRVDFLKKYIEYLENQDTFEDQDKAYRLSKELNFKESLIIQREQQIKQANDQEELKKKCIEEMPDLIYKAWLVVQNMVVDIDSLKTKKRNKKENEFFKALKDQKEQVDTILRGIDARFNANPDYPELINDFRQVHEIIKLVK